MSTKDTQRLRPVALSVLLLAAASEAAAQPGQPIAVPLSDPSRPAMLEVSLMTGSISVTAYEGDEIVIVARDDDDDDEDRDDDDEPRADGLVRIPNSSIGLTAEERDNRVSIQMDFTQRSVELEISVPRMTSVHATTINGGDVNVAGVSGEHELANVNGDVIATDIAGAAVVGTTNGHVEVTFTEIAPGKAMSFSSFNGDVDVTFPANLAANLRVNSGQGDLWTDFEVKLEQQPTVVERGGNRGGRYQVRMEREMRAIVGGGGPDMQFTTFNGDIRIRKR